MSDHSPLSERLKALGVRVGTQDITPPPRQVKFTIEAVAPGRFVETARGQAFIVDHYYDADYRHGRQHLFPSIPFQNLARWAGNPELGSLPPQAFAFLDTETSGLAGGTGTYVFLAGVARLEGGVFHLAQFFMRDPTEEGALLLALEEFLTPCQALVTFNGKSFDCPLLNSRYTLQGWRSPLPDLGHIDLLHLARRLYRDQLPSRTLGSLEVALLDLQRSEEEVPGWLIPQLYFDYLRTGDARPMRSVLYHNAMDVVSMAALLSHLGHLLEDPMSASEDPPVDYAAIGRLFDDLHDDQMAAQLYRFSLDHGLPENLFWDTLERLSFLHKRRGEYDEAIQLWQKAARHGYIYAHVEIAKVYEHHRSEPDQALEWTEQAIQLAMQPDFSVIEKTTWLQELQRRRDRLQRKMTSR